MGLTDPRDIAGLKRKHARTEDPVKKAELANHLRMLGEDPDEVKEVKDVPEGRASEQERHVTADESKPVREDPGHATRRPARPARGAGDVTLSKPSAEDK